MSREELEETIRRIVREEFVNTLKPAINEYAKDLFCEWITAIRVAVEAILKRAGINWCMLHSCGKPILSTEAKIELQLIDRLGRQRTVVLHKTCYESYKDEIDQLVI